MADSGALAKAALRSRPFSHAQSLDLVPKRPLADLEQPRGSGLASAGPLQRLVDQMPLQLVHVQAQGE